MTVIRPNSVSGINSITAQANEIKIFKSDGTQGGLIIGGANLNATSGISTVAALTVTGNVSVGGTLTYQDVTNIDSVGVVTARAGVHVTGGNLAVGHNNPSVNLHVRGSASNGQIYLGGTGAHSQIYADNDGVLILNADQGNSAANSYLGFNVDNSEKVRITSAGLVGIGTQTPDATLKVNVASGNNGVVVQNTSTANIALFGARNGDATVQIGQWGSTASGSTFGLSNADLSFIYTTSYNTTHPSALALGTVSNKPIVFATNNTERLRIASDGQATFDKGAVGGANQVIARFQAESSRRLDIVWHDSGSLLGFDLPGSHSYIFKTAGTERLRIAANGNTTFKHKVNIGASHTGGEILALGKTSGTSYMAFHNGGANMGFIGYADQLIAGGASNEFGIRSQDDLLFAAGGNAERLRITSGGLMGLGTSSPGSYIGGGENLVIAGSGNAGMTIATGTSNTGTINFADGTSGDARYRGRFEYSHSLDALDILTAASTRVRIDSIGRLLVNTLSPSNGASFGNLVLEFAGNSYNGIKTRDTDNTGAVTHLVFVSGSAAVGSITGDTGQAYYNNLSDYRRKENDVEIADGIQKLKLLRPIRFNYISDPNTVCDGFFAHEVTPAVPTAVTGAKDAVDSEGEIDPQMLDASKLVPLLTAALQEAIAKIETLEAAVTALQG